jgi:hypothetical protein
MLPKYYGKRCQIMTTQKLPKIVHKDVDITNDFAVNTLRERMKANKIVGKEESPVVTGFLKRDELPDYQKFVQTALPWRQLDFPTKWRSANARHLVEIGAFRAALPEFFGEKGLRMLYDIYCSFGYTDYVRSKERGLLKGNDALALGSHLMTVYDIQAFDPKVDEASPKKVVISLYHGLPDHCPYGIGKGQVELCRATIGYEETLAKLLNPKLKTYLSKCKAAGDPTCTLVIEQKD